MKPFYLTAAIVMTLTAANQTKAGNPVSGASLLPSGSQITDLSGHIVRLA